MKIRPLTKDLQEKAERELNEIPRQIEENLKSLRNWLEKQEHIRYKDDDQFLLNVMRICKHNLQRTKAKLEGYYTFRTIAPEIACNLDPMLPEVQAFIKIGMCIPLPIPNDDPASERIFLLHFGDYDPEVVTQITLMKVCYAISEILLREDDHYVVSGSKAIFDMKGVRLQTTLQITPNLVKKGRFCVENGLPTRVKAVYFINVPAFYELVINAVKPLVPKKLGDRVHAYSTDNLEAIYKDIPKSILPNEYGGNAGTIEDLAGKWKETIESHRENLLNEDNYHTIESAREHTDGTITDEFGVQGSFRRLEID